MTSIFSTRAKELAIDAACAFVAIVAALLIAPTCAHAYVDPSVMTYTIQALAGVAVALSTVAGVFYRRIRKRLVRVLGIDENAGKAVEPDVKAVSSNDLAAENEAMAEFWANAPQPGEARKLAFGSRLIRSLVVCLFTFCTLLLLAPAEMIVANAASLTYSLGDVWQPILLFALAVSAVAGILLALIPGKAFDVAMAVIAAIGACFWLQTLLLNGNLPSANGAPVRWFDYWLEMILSTVVWGGVIGACTYLAISKTKDFRRWAVAICALFVLVIGVGVGSIFADQSSMNAQRDDSIVYATRDGINTVSSKNNVIVFVLDMYDTNGFLDMYAERPNSMDEFEDFTFYKNSVGSIVPTKYALPYLMTGTYPQTDDDWYKDYMPNRYSRSTFLKDIYDAGYDLGIYTDSMGPRKQWAKESEYTINQHPLAKKETVDVNAWGTIAVMAKAALYRDAPWIAKAPFWFYTDDINIGMTPSGGLDPAATLYMCNDVRYHDDLVEEGLQIVDRGTEGSFRLIHLNGAHWPYTMSSDMTTKAGTSYNDQAEGSMNIVSDYLRYMKELGIYDDATIIVTSDHGIWDWNHDELQEVTTPILFVKPARTEKDAASTRQPMVTSELPTGHCDYHATIIKAVTGSAGKYGTSVTDLTEENTKDRERLFLYPLHDGKSDKAIVEYSVKGDALDRSCWTESGRVWANE